MVMDNIGLAAAVGLNYLCRHTGEGWGLLAWVRRAGWWPWGSCQES